MPIQLYFLPGSFPSRCVLMTLKALNLPFESKVIDVTKGEQKTEEYLAINPLGKIPTIKDGNYIITESRAISMYLCEKYEKGDDSGRFYPAAIEARGKVNQMLFISEYMDTIIHSYTNTPGVLSRGEKANEGKLPEVHKALYLYEGFLKGSDYIASDHVTIADFYMFAAVQALSLIGFDDYKSYPKTKAWMERIKSLPYFDECQKEGMEMVMRAYKMFLEMAKNKDKQND